jgi:oligoribonuclease NrnB/cAMP/cGMP phosphodiesterase (DHH superfamily)
MNAQPEPKRILVLYHAHCADGFAAAVVAHQVFGERAEYLACRYDEPPPDILNGVRHVYVLDFSFPREVLLAWHPHLDHLAVLDHHQTAEAALAGLPFVRFEKDKSGAVMAWEYFREDAPEVIFGEPPPLLRYVQDRDLWQWELEESREVSAALRLRRFDFEEWGEMLWQGETAIRELRSEGRLVLRYQTALVESIANKRRMELWAAEDGAATGIPVVNTAILQSEVCHRLLELVPEAPWAAAYFQEEPTGNPGALQCVWSLRSRGAVDVSAIAKRRGGGGHHNAAGYTVLL